MTTLGFMGLGTMASAIINGLHSAEPPIKRLGYDPNQSNAHVSSVSLADLCQQSDCLVLCMKPTDIPNALNSLPSDHPPLISVAAGVPLSHYPKTVPVCRAMPNLAVNIQAGVSALCFNATSDTAFQTLVTRIFDTLGLTVTLTDEDQMHSITALSGSGPAFFYRIIQAFVTAGMQSGLSESTALSLVTHTALGAAKLVQKHERPSLLTLDAMINSVCSPGGTTAAGIQAFDATNISNHLHTVIEAARHRSKELGEKS